jgi:transposase
MFSEEQETRICKQYVIDKLSIPTLAKMHNCGVATINNIIERNGYKLRTKSESQKGKKQSEITKQKIRDSHSTPKNIQISLKNGFGKKCYYKGILFASTWERDYYIYKKEKQGLKIIYQFLGQFDFLEELKNGKIQVSEIHPFFENTGCDRNGKTEEQYYESRRKLLNKHGYKDLKLVVIKDLKEIETIKRF